MAKPYALKAVAVLMAISVIITMSPATAEERGYLVVHAVNPEGVEIPSMSDTSGIGGLLKVEVTICADGSEPNECYFITLDRHDICEPIAYLSPGNYIVTAVFNGMEITKNVNIVSEQFSEPVFLFERTICRFPFMQYEAEAILSGTWSFADHPDVSRITLDDGDGIRARVSLWLSLGPSYAGRYFVSSHISLKGLTYQARTTIDVATATGTGWAAWATAPDYPSNYYSSHIRIEPISIPAETSFDYWISQCYVRSGVSYPGIDISDSNDWENFRSVLASPWEPMIWPEGDPILLPASRHYRYVRYSLPYLTHHDNKHLSGDSYRGSKTRSGRPFHSKISSVPYDILGTGVVCESINAPIAAFTYTPEEPMLGEYVIFDGSASRANDGPIVDYRWEFGDGNSVSGPNSVVSYAYNKPGEYTVTLAVVDSEGFRSKTEDTVKIPVRTHVLSVGIRQDITDPKDPNHHFRGDIGAKRVSEAFGSLTSIVYNDMLQMDVDDSNSITSNRAKMESALELVEAGLWDGDTFVFYINCHGTYDKDCNSCEMDEAAVTMEDGTISTGDERLYISPRFSRSMSDDYLSGLFVDDKWDKVNKLFIMDTCYGGGYWGKINGVDSGDLSRLPRAAILAAAPESHRSHYRPDPPCPEGLGPCGPAWGVLGQAVVSSLKSFAADSTISFSGLAYAVNVAGSQYEDLDGYIQDYNDPNWGTPAKIQWQLMAEKTADFSLGLGVPSSFAGDINGDGSVNLLDLLWLARNWLQSDFLLGSTLQTPYDGVVNFIDFAPVANRWLSTEDCEPGEDMVLLQGGEFQMGDHFGEEEGWDAVPVHPVTLGEFYLSRHETTNQEYCEFLNSANSQGLLSVIDGVVYQNGTGTDYPYCETSTSSSDTRIDYNDGVFSIRDKAERSMTVDPAVHITWYGAVAYCNWKSRQKGRDECYDLSDWTCDFTKSGYRLPTEAEWEYAVRGGRHDPYLRFAWGNTIAHSQANYRSWGEKVYDVSPTIGYHPVWNDGTEPYTAPVGSFVSNDYGLYDMSGNVWEWCNDRYNPYYYQTSPQVNPLGPSTGSTRVLRGGGWLDSPEWCRSANRVGVSPDYRTSRTGFRVAMKTE